MHLAKLIISPLSGNRKGLWVSLTFLVLGLVVTWVAVTQTQRFVAREQQAEFNVFAARMRNELALHTYRHVDILRSYGAEFAAHSDLSQDALLRLTAALRPHEHLPGIEAIGYIQYSPDGGDWVLAPPGYRMLYSRYGAPHFKATPQPVVESLREALLRARDTGSIAATPPFRLPGARHTFVMVFLPIYERGTANPDTVTQRRDRFKGAFFVALESNGLLGTFYDNAIAAHTRVQLRFLGYDDPLVPAPATPPILFYDSQIGSLPVDAPDTLNVSMPLELGGTQWAIDLSTDGSHLARSQAWLPWAVMVAGVLLTLISAMVIDFMRRARLRSLQRSQADEQRRRSAEAALHLRHRAIESSANAIVICSATEPGYPVEYVNPAFERMTGYTAEEVCGQSLRILHNGDGEQDGVHTLRELISSRKEGHATLRNYRKDGKAFWTQVHISPVRDEQGEVTHFVAAKYDITKTVEYQEQLEFQAWHDALTGLPNRHLLMARMNETLRQTRNNGRVMWVAFLDLDNFKLMNDTLGHGWGDVALQRIAKRLTRTLAGDDVVSRRGGDEFVFILFDDPAPHDALSKIGRIRAAVARPLVLGSHRFFPTCSVGIAVHPRDGTDAETLIKHADMAMYYAKTLGRNNHQFFSAELQQQALQRVRLEGDLRAALAADQFELHYQPQMRLEDDCIIGVEALVRWRHPERGMIPPDQFIPLAEETGLIVELGEWILREACSQMRSWLDSGMPFVRVAVNLSARQFGDPELPRLIHQTLQKNEFPGRHLELELTETLLVDDFTTANQTLHRLKSLGVILSLDDFGTGYSSMSQLRRFPLDIIKIDRSFVSCIGTDTGSDSIVRTIIALAHSLGLSALAEGVETAEQLAFLRRHGCDAIQGFHVCRPLPPDVLREWVTSRQACTV